VSRYPVIYAGLVDRALAKPLPEWEVAVQTIADAFARSVTDLGIEQLRRAYVAGVCDGFAQGVAAESERRDAPAESRGAS
jgi:hypothetical protein